MPTYEDRSANTCNAERRILVIELKIRKKDGIGFILSIKFSQRDERL